MTGCVSSSGSTSSQPSSLLESDSSETERESAGASRTGGSAARLEDAMALEKKYRQRGEKVGQKIGLIKKRKTFPNGRYDVGLQMNSNSRIHGPDWPGEMRSFYLVFYRVHHN